jgi:hypothetical protein
MPVWISGSLLAAALLTTGAAWAQTTTDVPATPGPTAPAPGPTLVLTPGPAGATPTTVLPPGAVSVPTPAVVVTPGPTGPTTTAILAPAVVPSQGPHPTLLVTPGPTGLTPIGVLTPGPGGPTPAALRGPLPPGPTPLGPAPTGAFQNLSPGNQKIAKALFSAQVPPTPTRTPLTLDQVAALKATSG